MVVGKIDTSSKCPSRVHDCIVTFFEVLRNVSLITVEMPHAPFVPSFSLIKTINAQKCQLSEFNIRAAEKIYYRMLQGNYAQTVGTKISIS